MLGKKSDSKVVEVEMQKSSDGFEINNLEVEVIRLVDKLDIVGSKSEVLTWTSP